eukprot:1161558-Pelagomonas_calceolata.AAC.10
MDQLWCNLVFTCVPRNPSPAPHIPPAWQPACVSTHRDGSAQVPSGVHLHTSQAFSSAAYISRKAARKQ